MPNVARVYFDRTCVCCTLVAAMPVAVLPTRACHAQARTHNQHDIFDDYDQMKQYEFADPRGKERLRFLSEAVLAMAKRGANQQQRQQGLDAASKAQTDDLNDLLNQSKLNALDWKDKFEQKDQQYQDAVNELVEAQGQNDKYLGYIDEARLLIEGYGDKLESWQEQVRIQEERNAVLRETLSEQESLGKIRLKKQNESHLKSIEECKTQTDILKAQLKKSQDMQQHLVAQLDYEKKQAIESQQRADQDHADAQNQIDDNVRLASVIKRLEANNQDLYARQQKAVADMEEWQKTYEEVRGERETLKAERQQLQVENTRLHANLQHAQAEQAKMLESRLQDQIKFGSQIKDKQEEIDRLTVDAGRLAECDAIMKENLKFIQELKACQQSLREQTQQSWDNGARYTEHVQHLSDVIIRWKAQAEENERELEKLRGNPPSKPSKDQAKNLSDPYAFRDELVMLQTRLMRFERLDEEQKLEIAAQKQNIEDLQRMDELHKLKDKKSYLGLKEQIDAEKELVEARALYDGLINQVEQMKEQIDAAVNTVNTADAAIQTAAAADAGSQTPAAADNPSEQARKAIDAAMHTATKLEQDLQARDDELNRRRETARAEKERLEKQIAYLQAQIQDGGAEQAQLQKLNAIINKVHTIAQSVQRKFGAAVTDELGRKLQSNDPAEAIFALDRLFSEENKCTIMNLFQASVIISFRNFPNFEVQQCQDIDADDIYMLTTCTITTDRNQPFACKEHGGGSGMPKLFFMINSQTKQMEWTFFSGVTASEYKLSGTVGRNVPERKNNKPLSIKKDGTNYTFKQPDMRGLTGQVYYSRESRDNTNTHWPPMNLTANHVADTDRVVTTAITLFGDCVHSFTAPKEQEQFSAYMQNVFGNNKTKLMIVNLSDRAKKTIGHGLTAGGVETMLRAENQEGARRLGPTMDFLPVVRGISLANPQQAYSTFGESHTRAEKISFTSKQSTVWGICSRSFISFSGKKKEMSEVTQKIVRQASGLRPIIALTPLGHGTMLRNILPTGTEDADCPLSIFMIVSDESSFPGSIAAAGATNQRYVNNFV